MKIKFGDLPFMVQFACCIVVGAFIATMIMGLLVTFK